MTTIMFRIIFWGLFIAMGTQTGFGLFKMRDKMRELALKQVATPWPKLQAAPRVDYSKYRKHTKGTKRSRLDDVLIDAVEIVEKIQRDLKR